MNRVAWTVTALTYLLLSKGNVVHAVLLWRLWNHKSCQWFQDYLHIASNVQFWQMIIWFVPLYKIPLLDPFFFAIKQYYIPHVQLYADDTVLCCFTDTAHWNPTRSLRQIKRGTESWMLSMCCSPEPDILWTIVCIFLPWVDKLAATKEWISAEKQLILVFHGIKSRQRFHCFWWNWIIF